MPSKAQVQTLIDTNLPTNAIPKIRSEKHREVENAILDYATNIIKIATVSAGTTVTDARMANRDVAEIVVNSNSKTEGFTKPTAGTTLTLTDGSTFSNGDTTIIKLL